MKKILIAGGSGLIGSRLTEILLQKGSSVSHLSRKAGNKNGVNVFEWNAIDLSVDAEAFDGVDTIINLAGAGIADKAWTHIPERSNPRFAVGCVSCHSGWFTSELRHTSALHRGGLSG